jgi:cytochrome b561
MAGSRSVAALERTTHKAGLISALASSQEKLKMKRVSRYHPLLVTLHWVLAVLIIAALTIGFFILAATPNTDPQKITVLRIHMAAGMLILALMVIRFIVRMLTSRPEAATTGYPFLDRIAPITHYGFYVLVLLMVGTGYATAILAGLNKIVFQGSGDPLPPSFGVYPTFVAHGYIAAFLAGFIVLHVLAALYHQFVRRDGLLRRMFFGRRVLNSSASVH